MIKVNSVILKEMVKGVSKAISSKSTMPILQGIKIQLVDSDSKFIFQGTDLELGIETSTIEVATTSPFNSIVVDATLFSKIIANVKGEETTLEMEGELLVVTSDTAEFKLPVMGKGEDYPNLPEVKGEKLIIKGAVLKDMISKVSYAVAQDDAKPILTGVLLELIDNVLNCVALDGYRIAHSFKEVESEGKSLKAIIPSKSINELAKLSPNDNIELSLTENQLVATFSNGNISTRVSTTLLQGDYINYKGLFPSEFTSRILPKKSEIIDKVKSITLLSSKENNLFKMIMTEEKVEFTANSVLGVAKDKLITRLEGKDLTIAFNSQYFIEGIKAMEEDEVEIKFTSNVSPCLIEEEGFKYLVLPVRILQ